jgi:hypothetical protein
MQINSVHERPSMFRAKLANQIAKDLSRRGRDDFNLDVILRYYHDNADKF